MTIHHPSVIMAAMAMLHLLYMALRNLLSGGMIPVMHRSRMMMYGEMI